MEKHSDRADIGDEKDDSLIYENILKETDKISIRVPQGLMKSRSEGKLNSELILLFLKNPVCLPVNIITRSPDWLQLPWSVNPVL